MCSGKATDSELYKNHLRHSWNQGSSPLTHSHLWCCVHVAMLCCRNLLHCVSATEKAEAEGGRQVEIRVVEKAGEALREVNLAGDSISGAQGSFARA